MGLFWAFLENGTPATCFFKKKFEMFSMVLFWNCECVVCKKVTFCEAFVSRGKSKKLGGCLLLFNLSPKLPPSFTFFNNLTYRHCILLDDYIKPNK
jgi:hypothetical protein